MKRLLDEKSAAKNEKIKRRLEDIKEFQDWGGHPIIGSWTRHNAISPILRFFFFISMRRKSMIDHQLISFIFSVRLLLHKFGHIGAVIRGSSILVVFKQ